MGRRVNCVIYKQQHTRLPAPPALARWLTFSTLVCSAVFGQSLSITNYQIVSQDTNRRTINVTYRADLVNTGTGLETLTATVASLNPNVQVTPGQDTLQFGPVPANSQVTSSNTFTLQLSNAAPVDFSQLRWTFTSAGILLPANVTVAPGNTVNFPVTLGVPAPAAGVFISLTSSNPSVATVSPATFFVPQGTTTAPRVLTTVTGNGGGSATITASAPGYATASGQVQVPSGGTPATTMSFWPASLTVNQASTQNLTLNLSAPAPTGLVVSLTSSDPTVAIVPATVNFATGATSVSVPATGVADGSVTVTASAPNIASTTASITVPHTASAGILVPANVTVSPGSSVNLPATLSTGAPAGGVTITLASSNPSMASVWPTTLFIPQGMTAAPRSTAMVTGNSAGSPTITASAPGYASANTQVQVPSGGITAAMTMSLSPASLTINGATTQNLTLNLSAPAPAGLVVGLSSSNQTVATVPQIVSVGIGANSVSVPVTGVASSSRIGHHYSQRFQHGKRYRHCDHRTTGRGWKNGPPSLIVSSGKSMNFPVTLGAAAPPGGVTITLVTSDPTVAAVSPSTLSIPQGLMGPQQGAPTVTGVSGGSVIIAASAFGYPTANSKVQVTPPVIVTMTMGFSPTSMNILGTAIQSLTLNLSAPAPAAFAITLTSSNSGVATVPPTATLHRCDQCIRPGHRCRSGIGQHHGQRGEHRQCRCRRHRHSASSSSRRDHPDGHPDGRDESVRTASSDFARAGPHGRRHRLPIEQRPVNGDCDTHTFYSGQVDVEQPATASGRHQSWICHHNCNCAGVRAWHRSDPGHRGRWWLQFLHTLWGPYDQHRHYAKRDAELLATTGHWIHREPEFQ